MRRELRKRARLTAYVSLPLALFVLPLRFLAGWSVRRIAYLFLFWVCVACVINAVRAINTGLRVDARARDLALRRRASGDPATVRLALTTQNDFTTESMARYLEAEAARPVRPAALARKIEQPFVVASEVSDQFEAEWRRRDGLVLIRLEHHATCQFYLSVEPREPTMWQANLSLAVDAAWEITQLLSDSDFAPSAVTEVWAA